MAKEKEPEPKGVVGGQAIPAVRLHTTGRKIGEGALAAAGRLGLDELAAALKAFPDSIQKEEIGTIGSPTQAEITNSRKPRLPTPSEIARDKTPYKPEHGQGNDNNHDHGRER